ncbi:MAG: SBBP repeat-containing protein [Bacteroidetes bacterium]|nr:SBBP repeat-containing protein [Bacteroidota bacterium]
MKQKHRLLILTIVLFIYGSMFANGNVNKQKVFEKEQQLKQDIGAGGISFTPNKGQMADKNGKPCPDILYKGDGAGADIYLRKTGISYVYSNMAEVMHEVFEKVEEMEHSGNGLGNKTAGEWEQELMQKEPVKIHRVDMDFAGCNTNITTVNENELEGYNNYYYAHLPAEQAGCPGGILNVKQYNKVTYKNIYNNIDVSYYGNSTKGLKYDLIVQPHADPDQIQLHWKYAENIHLNRQGNSSTGLTTSLVIKTGVNEFYESIPKVYQIINGKIIDIKTKYILTPVSTGEAIISFSFSAFNSSFPLIIDPWVTYYGGNNYDNGTNIITDAMGNVYVTGWTGSTASIASGGFQNVFGGIEDALLVKFNPAGVRLWATYYGGTSQERAYGVQVDPSGNVYLAGYTSSPTGIASAGAFQTVFAGGSDAFLAKFNSAGIRLWATYYGGTGGDAAYNVNTDNAGNVYLTGNTNSASGIAFGGFQNTLSGGLDAILVKFDSAGNRLWATYYGGTGFDYGYSVLIDVSFNVYMAGRTTSVSGIASSGFQNAYGGGLSDAYLVKFNSVGGRTWATYYGGTGRDEGNSVASDISGNVYLAGYTSSTTGIAVGGFQNIIGGAADAFLVKFDPTGLRLWGTYIGGSLDDYALKVVVDPVTNDAYLSGDTYSLNFPVTSCAWQQTLAGGISEDGFVSHFNSGGQIVCSSYVGGPAVPNDEDCRIALYGCYIYMTGFTSGIYPVTAGAHQTVFGGQNDIVVAQLYKSSCGFNKTPDLIASANTNSVCPNTPINFTGNFKVSCDNSVVNYKWSFPGGMPSTSANQNPTGILYSGSGNYAAQLIAFTPCDTDTVYVNITINPCGGITANVNSATICGGTTPCPTLSATGASGTVPYTYIWSTTATTAGINPCPASTTNYTVTITDNAGLTATSVAVVTVNPMVSATVTPTNINCSGNTNGSAIANPGNGTPAYTFNWSNGGSGFQVSGLSAGTYTVTITDNKGCTATSTAIIVSPQALAVLFNKGTANCTACGCKEWIMVTATGGTNPYSYTWPDGYTNRYKNKLCRGAYNINIKDKNGCSINVNLTTP